MSERCVTCGCELAYPTAIHLVDCPLTETKPRLLTRITKERYDEAVEEMV